jgi:hypothetical protein
MDRVFSEGEVLVAKQVVHAFHEQNASAIAEKINDWLERRQNNLRVLSVAMSEAWPTCQNEADEKGWVNALVVFENLDG